MSLNKKQWAGIAAVLGGLATLPVVFAMTEDPMIPLIIQQQQNAAKQPPINGISDVNGNKITQRHENNNVTILSNTDSTNYGPASRNGLTSRDVSAQERQALSHSTEFQNVSGYNQTANKGFGTSSQADCSYSQAAYRTGVKHYRFDQANESTLVAVGGGHRLTPEAASALRKLQAAARADGVTLTVGSAFRSVSYQQGIVSRKKAAGQSDAQIYKVSSAPGYSEHHTGYTVDFSPINNSFANTKAYDWLRRNAPAMGWEQSFTPESTRNTHVAVESWHWKYKGSATAKAALANDVCYFRPF